MSKLVFLVLLAIVAVILFKRLARLSDTNQPDTEGLKESNIESMVQCAHCHVHLPRSEAFLIAGEFYCSQTHYDDKKKAS